MTPQAIANRAVKPLFEIDGRKMYRLGDIHGHDGARVADAMESALDHLDRGHHVGRGDHAERPAAAVG